MQFCCLDDIALIANSQEELQQLVNVAVNYAKRWRFLFNIHKCECVNFGQADFKECLGDSQCNYNFDHVVINGVKIRNSITVKYLGVDFDIKLTWNVTKIGLQAKHGVLSR